MTELDVNAQAADDLLRKVQLWKEHGKPTQYDTTTALRALGLLGEVHPVDAYAYLHDTQAAMEAYAEANMDIYGHPTWRLAVPDVGFVGVIDLRPALTQQSVPVTPPDPTL